MRSLGLTILAACALWLGAGSCDRKVAGGEADGAKIFSQVCARCHGPEGEPNASMVARYGVKNLRTEHAQHQMTDAQIRKQILEGSKNKQMPSFEGALTEAQIKAVIAHVRSLGVDENVAGK